MSVIQLRGHVTGSVILGFLFQFNYHVLLVYFRF